MSIDSWIQITIAVVCLVIVPGLFGLIKVLHANMLHRLEKLEKANDRLEDRMEDRFRSMGHRVEELRSTVQGITELFIDKPKGR